MEALPHLTIRPPHLKNAPSIPEVEAVTSLVSKVLLSEPTLGALMPLKEEKYVKSYLLHPETRKELLLQSGAEVQMVSGTEGAAPLLKDKSFLVLHYRLTLDSSGAPSLFPCISGEAGDQRSRVLDDVAVDWSCRLLFPA